LLSSDVSVGKSHLLDKWKFYRFKRKNQKWIHSFCINHDGTILTQKALSEKDQIVDIELVQAIYKTLSDENWDGKLEDVYKCI
jgi:hypothetical protein